MHCIKMRSNFLCLPLSFLPYLSPVQGKQLTSHPCVKQELEESGHYSYSEARVCKDGTTITSRGPGTCFEFALAIVATLCGEDVVKEISAPMMLPPK